MRNGNDELILCKLHKPGETLGDNRVGVSSVIDIVGPGCGGAAIGCLRATTRDTSPCVFLSIPTACKQTKMLHK